MKKVLLLMLLASFGLAGYSCEKEDVTEGDTCIDPAMIDTDDACYTLYDPVCGCNNVTYSNSCEATASGVKEYTPGECSD
ncbi:MAG: Kazal-type serine protease inhibitor family protein [Cyclobacteriaceae bacterium]